MRDINVSVHHLIPTRPDLTWQGPIWVGEFGPVYASPKDGLDNWEEINESRYDVAKAQIDIYRKSRASWSIWIYKGR